MRSATKMNKPSLRDMKKETTGSTLARGAFELAMQHGLDGFSIDDVVQQAGYSRRTFSNYFASKEEAVAKGAVACVDEGNYEDFLNKIPEDMPILDVLGRLIRMQFTTEFIRRIHELVAVSKRYPTLEPYVLSQIRSVQSMAQEAIMELSKGQYDMLYTHLLAGTLYGAFLPLIDGSVNVLLPDQAASEDPEAITFNQYMDTVFGYLRNGY